MQAPTTIKSVLQRTMAKYEKNPDSAINTTTCLAVIGKGMYCTVQEGDAVLRMDLPKSVGGEGLAVSPGVFGRACIAGCVAMGIRIAAELQDCPVGNIQVELAMEFDDRGIFSMTKVTAAPIAPRLNIALETSVSQAQIDALVSHALAHDPWFLALQMPYEVGVTVQPLEVT